MTSHKHTISVLVENEFGVLARVSGMFAARGYNIDSLSVAPTLDPKVSHITIETRGSDLIIEQILKQLNRLIDVIQVRDLTGSAFINLETLLIRIKRDRSTEAQVLKILESIHAEKVDENAECFIFQITGEKEKVESLLQQLKPLGILELVRTGTLAISRGNAK